MTTLGKARAAGRAAVASIDLGATSGRVMLAVIHGEHGQEHIEIIEAARFPNGPGASQDAKDPGLRWDVTRLWEAILEGLRVAGGLAREQGLSISAIGVDSWAVDYGLIDSDGNLLGLPRSYRDSRLEGVAEQVAERISDAEQYRINGLQRLPFTTEYQLVAGRDDPEWADSTTLVLIPDLVVFWLTGRRATEVTNASTTGLIDATTRSWSREMIDRLVDAYPALGGLEDRLTDLVEPGTVVGVLTASVQKETGLGPVPVVAVGSHDTASAIVGVPAQHQDFAYISSGTWSLVGLELEGPVLTEQSRRANITNELGVDGTVRYLKNVSGLWVLSESLRTWNRTGRETTLAEALSAAEQAAPKRTVIDLDSPAFLPPGDMPSRIAEAARTLGQPEPNTVGQVTRCILDSLAASYARALEAIETASGRTIDVVHIVGGGSQNDLLCRLTAEAIDLPVIAGPIEGAALGNALVAARGAGLLDGDLAALRTVVARSATVRRYEAPSPRRPHPGRTDLAPHAEGASNQGVSQHA